MSEVNKKYPDTLVLTSIRPCMGGCQTFAVLRFSPIFSCGFAVFAYFLCGFEVFADFSCGFAVSIVACGLRFPTKILCGFSVFGHFELRFCGFYRFQTFEEFIVTRKIKKFC